MLLKERSLLCGKPVQASLCEWWYGWCRVQSEPGKDGMSALYDLRSEKDRGSFIA